MSKPKSNCCNNKLTDFSVGISFAPKQTEIKTTPAVPKFNPFERRHSEPKLSETIRSPTREHVKTKPLRRHHSSKTHHPSKNSSKHSVNEEHQTGQVNLNCNELYLAMKNAMLLNAVQKAQKTRPKSVPRNQYQSQPRSCGYQARQEYYQAQYSSCQTNYIIFAT